MMFLTPLELMSSQVCGLARMRSRAAAMASESVGSTTTPWCRVAMMSTGPPFLVATVGTPWAAASITVSPKGSCRAGLTNTPRVACKVEGGGGGERA